MLPDFMIVKWFLQDEFPGVVIPNKKWHAHFRPSIIKPRSVVFFLGGGRVSLPITMPVAFSSQISFSCVAALMDVR